MTYSTDEEQTLHEAHDDVAALAKRIDALQAVGISRDEFEELKRMVKSLAARMDQIAPSDQIPDEHLAVMCAVFAATIGKRFRIKQVQHVQEPSGWAQAGRVNLHAQRHVRRT